MCYSVELVLLYLRCINIGGMLELLVVSSTVDVSVMNPTLIIKRFLLSKAKPEYLRKFAFF